MIEASAWAASVWRGAPVWLVPTAIVALHQPVVAGIGVGVWVARDRRRSRTRVLDEEERFLRDLATGLRGGASPRGALLSAARRSARPGMERVRAAIERGLDDDLLARDMARALPESGHLVGTALMVGRGSGAPLAGIIEMVAHRVAERTRLMRETRAETAQARASAWVISAIPAALLLFLWLSGRISRPGVAPVVAVGATLQLAGVAAIVLLVRRP